MTQKKSNAIDGHIGQVINARWLAMGLSQTDLAEVLGLAFREKDDIASKGAGARRVAQIAQALDVPVDFFYRQPGETTEEERDLSLPASSNALQSLLALRLLRAFHALTDQATKEVLVQLAEQIVKRQRDRR
jgi:transcriptional regulator with XRE-family HTH domain